LAAWSPGFAERQVGHSLSVIWPFAIGYLQTPSAANPSHPPFNLKTAVEPTQRRKGAETQRLRLLSTLTRWMSHLNLSFPRHVPVPCAFASWRLCVNCRFWFNPETPKIALYLVLVQGRLTLQVVCLGLAHFQLLVRPPKCPSPPTGENPGRP
jgi:hypothetical protein